MGKGYEIELFEDGKLAEAIVMYDENFDELTVAIATLDFGELIAITPQES